MGRPINKRYFGARSGVNDQSIGAYAQIGANAEGEGYIVKQRSSSKFKVTVGANTGICTLVNKAIGSLAADEMLIQGFTSGMNAVNLRKLTSRLAYDWDNNKYTWAVEDDSSTTILRLTAV
jgi:hypothetical protein